MNVSKSLNCAFIVIYEGKQECPPASFSNWELTTCEGLYDYTCGGYSGALVLSEDGRAIGLAIGRYLNKKGVAIYGFAIPIQYILNNLEVDLAIF